MCVIEIIIIIIIILFIRKTKLYITSVWGGFEIFSNRCQWPVATGHVGYTTRVQNWTCVAYPTCPMTLATKQKSNPFLISNEIVSTLII